jgi:flagella basal body P-ring formation protein FlgA
MINLLAITLSLATAFGGGEGTDIEARIRTGAVARGTDIRIGELCEFTPINEHTLHLSNLVFAPTPAGGRARTISRTEILMALAAAGQNVGSLTFAGPKEIVVQPVLTEIPQLELVEAATAALEALIAVEGGDVEIDSPTQLRRHYAPPGRQSRFLDASVRTGRTGASSAVVDVDVMIDGSKHVRIPIMFKLQRYHMLLKTKGVIRANTPLGPHNLSLMREPIAMLTGLYLTRIEDVAGMVAARNLQSNARITLGDVASPAAIHRGDIVTVVLTKGRVRITTKAVANHDAPIDGRITVTNLRSRGAMSGLVVAPGLVVIHN